MRRLARHFFTLCSAVSLLLCVAVGALWAGSYRVTTAREFRYGGAVWEVASEKGRLRLDNAPQREREKAEWSRQWKVLSDECMSLYRQSVALGRRPKANARHEPPEIGEQRERLAALVQANANARRVMSGKPAYKTALVTHATPHAVAVGVLVIPFAFWLGAVARAALRRRGRLANRLCVHCGYDLRASRDRCPECGTSAELPLADAGIFS